MHNNYTLCNGGGGGGGGGVGVGGCGGGYFLFSDVVSRFLHLDFLFSWIKIVFLNSHRSWMNVECKFNECWVWYEIINVISNKPYIQIINVKVDYSEKQSLFDYYIDTVNYLRIPFRKFCFNNKKLFMC